MYADSSVQGTLTFAVDASLIRQSRQHQSQMHAVAALTSACQA